MKTETDLKTKCWLLTTRENEAHFHQHPLSLFHLIGEHTQQGKGMRWGSAGPFGTNDLDNVGWKVEGLEMSLNHNKNEMGG